METLHLFWMSLLLAFPLHGADGGGRKSTGNPVLDRRIDAALKRGVARLVRWLPYLEADKKALVLFAALEGGAGKKNPIIEASLKSMIRYRPPEAYGMGIQLMLLGKHGGGMAMDVLPKRIQALLSLQGKYGGWCSDKDYKKFYGVPDSRSTQLAVFGLYSAYQAGIPVWRGVVLRAADFLLRVQSPDGGFHKIIGSTHLCGNGDTDVSTAGCVAALIMCRKMAGKTGLGYEREKKVKRAIEKGFLWLDFFFEDSFPKGDMNRDRGIFLFNLERAMVLLGKEKLGWSSWYAYGARYVLDLQQPDGSWEEDPDISAFAVLFLAHAFRSFRFKSDQEISREETPVSPEEFLLRLPENAEEKDLGSFVKKLVRMGLPAVPACLKALWGPSEVRRRTAAAALEQITGLRTTFEPEKCATFPGNQKAARVWERWWMEHRGREGMEGRRRK